MPKILLLFLLGTTFLNAQVQSFAEAMKPQPGRKYNTFWVEYVAKWEKQYGLESIKENKNEYSFRLSFNNTDITIYKYGAEIFGNVKLVANDAGEFKKGDFFKMTYSLTAQQAKAILKVIDSTAIDTIPTQDDIKEWKQGFDGVTYTLQQNKDGHYTFKDYWTPDAQFAVPEAVAIDNFQSKVLELIDYSDLYESFTRQVPFICYSMGSSWIACKILTKEESRQLKRERRKQEKAHKN